MKYKVIIEKKATKEAENIPKKVRPLIDRAIISLQSNPRPHNSKKLTAKEGYRLRIGDYRILYIIDDETKTIIIYRIKIKGKIVYK